MAIEQPLKGGTNKVYSVINNFNKGIDKKTADDVSVDSSFRELKNFYNSNEGILSKRPAVYNSNIRDFIKAILDGEYSSSFTIVNNKFDETPETVLTRLQDFYDTVLLGEKKTATQGLDTITFQTDKIIGFQIIKNNKFLEALQDYQTILNGEYSSLVGSSVIEFTCILVAGGFSTKNNTDKTTGLYITRANILMEYTTNIGYNVKVELDSVDPTVSASPIRRWLYRPENYDSEFIQEVDSYKPLGPIDIANYNGYSYIPTGRNYFIEIDQIPENKTTHATYTNEASLFKIIGGDENENLYRPTAIELTQIGFNILSSNPLEYYNVSGTTVKVKGVFYSLNITQGSTTFKQPIAKIPYNTPFNLHVLYTGSTQPDTNAIKYRPNNGDTSTETNPYKDLPGSWNTEKTIFQCSGIDSDRSFEIQITLGSDIFLTYLTTTSNSIDETGYINEISKLVLASTRVKVVNNQLVLYGGHGYLFFSEYDMFNYFPNYYYIYIASEAGEESVTSINYFRQFYAVFTNKRIKRMAGSFGADDFGIYPLNDFVGCANGNTVRAVGNNLIFLGNDGLYQLKQGYLGEGTENVEKIDLLLNNELNINNVLQAFVINGNYVIVKTNGTTWIIYNAENPSFYEYNLESLSGEVYNGDSVDKDMAKKVFPFYTIFESNLYDSNGNFFIVPMYNYTYNSTYTDATLGSIDFMTFRFSNLDFLEEDKKHKDGYGFISLLETHKMNMGYPTNTKKFKDIFIKLLNESGHPIPLYITVIVDDNKIIDPETYKIQYDKRTNTYYYVKISESNKELDTSKVLGEFTLGKDSLGEKTIQQIKIRVGAKGRSIKIILRDGYNDPTNLGYAQRGLPTRNRNLYDFSIVTIGIVYKVKKVKEG